MVIARRLDGGADQRLGARVDHVVEKAVGDAHHLSEADPVLFTPVRARKTRGETAEVSLHRKSGGFPGIGGGQGAVVPASNRDVAEEPVSQCGFRFAARPLVHDQQHPVCRYVGDAGGRRGRPGRPGQHLMADSPGLCLR